MSINLVEFAYNVHSNALKKGFWNDNNGNIFYLKQVAMIHAEVSEITEAIAKKEDPDKIVVEMADVIIRVLDLWAGMNHDGVFKKSIETALKEKAEYNKTRPYMHGKQA